MEQDKSESISKESSHLQILLILCSNPDVVKIVSGMTGFYFGGGDQDQLKTVLSPNNNPSPVLEMIRKLWVNGMTLVYWLHSQIIEDETKWESIGRS
jgi:hypothetical protein